MDDPPLADPAYCPYGCSVDPDWVRDEEDEADRRWKRSHPMPADTLPPSGPPRCRICRFVIDIADDIALMHDSSTCICVACFGRETASEHVMPKELRLEISRIVNDVKG